MEKEQPIFFLLFLLLLLNILKHLIYLSSFQQFLKAFLGGAIVTILIILVEGFLSILIRPVNIFVIKIFLMAFLIAGLVEEGLKFSVFKLLIYRNKEFNEPYDGILYS
ncbi:MAG: PrsW family intramembrane metalloprotease, partial [Candidatus Lokiarchaeota archaeon]|nr:PrsW family intramembrane metalloprotease [Candidatus Lokiarchaeota archaeon]